MTTPLPPFSAGSHLDRRHLLAAALGTVAGTAAVMAWPEAAQAQDDTITDANAWVTDLIQASGAWETTKGKGVTVAVLDTGIGEHPFFEDKDILPGYSIFEDEEDAWNDTDGHGTAVTAGVLLVAPEATILPVRLRNGATDIGGTLGDESYAAIRWAVDNGADIINASWVINGTGFSGEDLEVLQYAIDKGAVFFAGAGNDPESEVGYPALVPGVVGVTGTDDSGEIWYEDSTVGPEVDVAAPAYTMTVPNPQTEGLGEDDLYRTIGGGTSLGSAITSGVAALIRSAHSDLDASNVIQRLIMTAGDGSGERHDDYGYGLVNADQAVNATDIATVDENPLGYPMGEAGASGASPDDSSSESSQDPGAATGGPSTSASGNKESNLSTIIVVAAAVVLIAAAVVVWLVLRGRGRKSAAAQETQSYGPGNDPMQGSYQQQPPPNHQQYGPPMDGGQGYGGHPQGPQGYSSPPSNQGFNPPGSPSEPSPPWQPSDPNRR